MRDRLLELVVCPMCGGAISVECFQRGSDREILNGYVLCEDCTQSFPLIDGIPRLLPPELQPMLAEMHPEFFEIFRDRLPPPLMTNCCGADTVRASDSALTAQRDTARSFGFEWQAFSEMLPDYESNFRWYFERFEPTFFGDKLVLDAGCGTGRHTFHMAQAGAREIVAMDFSQAIEVAARNNRENQNTHFVQADIYHPPFRPETFDFIYSLGVLHHLPEPEDGFRRLLPVLRRGEFANIYLYWNLETEALWRRGLLSLVTAFRRITTRMPHMLLKKLSWIIALLFEIVFVAPARLLARFGATRKLADRVPLGHYRKYSFRVLYTDQFDRFSAPIENRYGRTEVEGWFERAGFEEVVLLGGAGWRASGRKARG